MEERLSDMPARLFEDCNIAWMGTFCQSFTVSLSIFLDSFPSFFGWHFHKNIMQKTQRFYTLLDASEINETLAIYLCGDGLTFNFA